MPSGLARALLPVALLAAGCAGCASMRGASTLAGGLPATAGESAAHQPEETAGEEEPQIQPDRPDVTNATYTVPKGLVQLESGVQHSKILVSGESSATPVSVRVGVAHWFEARLDTDGLTRDKQLPETLTGFAGLTVGGKFRLWAPASGAPVVAVQPGVTLPWGRRDGGTDYALRVISGGDLPGHLHLDVNYSLGAIAAGPSHFLQHTASASANVSIGKRWNPYVETYWLSRLDAGSAGSATLDTGAIYTISERLAVDGGVAFGLTVAASGPAVFGGFSIILGAVTGHASVRSRLRDAQLRGDR